MECHPGGLEAGRAEALKEKAEEDTVAGAVDVDDEEPLLPPTPTPLLAPLSEPRVERLSERLQPAGPVGPLRAALPRPGEAASGAAVGRSGGRREHAESVTTRPAHQRSPPPASPPGWALVAHEFEMGTRSFRATSSSQLAHHARDARDPAQLGPCIRSTRPRAGAVAMRCSTLGMSPSIVFCGFRLLPAKAPESCVSTIITSQSSKDGAALTVRSLSPKTTVARSRPRAVMIRSCNAFRS